MNFVILIVSMLGMFFCVDPIQRLGYMFLSMTAIVLIELGRVLKEIEAINTFIKRIQIVPKKEETNKNE